MTATAVGPVAGLIALVAIGTDDEAIMHCMLQIVLGQHRVAARLRLARQREVLLGNVGGGAADPLCRAIRFEAARQRIAVMPLAVVVAATSAPVLLSLPHCLKGSRPTETMVSSAQERPRQAPVDTPDRTSRKCIRAGPV